MRALEKTDGLSCPGEAQCLKFKDEELPSDPIENLTIGSKYGRMKRRTLENYCHNMVVTRENWKCSDGSNRLQGCFLYETKSDNLSEAMQHSLETAEQFRNFKELGLLPSLVEISAYEFTCLDAAEKAVRTINAEHAKAKKPDNTQQPPDLGEKRPKKIGGEPR